MYLKQIDEVWLDDVGSIAIPTTKGLPYGIFLRQIFIEISERGQLNQLQKKWEKVKPDCGGPLNHKVKALNLEKLISAFIIVLFGILAALSILAIEKIFYACKPKTCVSNKEANKRKLQGIFKKLETNLDKDEIFLESTMMTMIKEMQNHNDLTN